MTYIGEIKYATEDDLLWFGKFLLLFAKQKIGYIFFGSEEICIILYKEVLGGIIILNTEYHKCKQENIFKE